MLKSKNWIVVFICFAQSIVFTNTALGQNTPIKRQSAVIYVKDSLTGDSTILVEVMPCFPMGNAGLKDFISNNVKYPAAARDSSAQGTVYVNFVVRASGKITDVKSLHVMRIFSARYKDRQREKKMSDAAYEPLEREAERVIRSMPDWLPGTQNDRPVNVVFTLPIRFTLQ